MAKLYFYYSSMNAGKTTVLLQSSYNYRERGMNTLLYTPKIDDRHAIGIIKARIGLQQEALPIDEDLRIFSDVERRLAQDPKIRCVLVDEAQFLTKSQVADLAKVTDALNIPVLAYGIRTDFRGEPFEGSLYLLAWADSLVEIKTICHCGRKATMNLRIDAHGAVVREGQQVHIGGNESYVATCRKHFWRGEFD
ncbi:MAG: thymidine kinase [Coxiella sp. RIFCSPHIGHO2_12_FULL_44_14]|nr:MAG: thymidine kinase [Coxiella sp. RIFCSPHIGHO2_12_FULL_44_14]